MNTKSLARTGIISALYVALTLCFAPISFGAIQFRVAECLTVLCFFYPSAIVGVTIGTLISDFFGNGILDIIFGTLASAIACTSIFLINKKVRNKKLAFISGDFVNAVINALIVPVTFSVAVQSSAVYFLGVAEIFLSEILVFSTLGLLTYSAVKRFNERK